MKLATISHIDADEKSPYATRTEITVSFLAANVYGTLFGMLLALLLIALFYFNWRGTAVQPPPDAFGVLHVLLLFIAGIVTHELMHGLGWMIFGAVPRSAIHFGIKWKLLTPYAHSSARMPVRGYRLGTLLPGLLLGILPSLFAILTGSLLVLGFGLFFTATAGGDFLILWLLRGIPANAQVEDHPSRVGSIVYS